MDELYCEKDAKSIFKKADGMQASFMEYHWEV
jgi:hypothetical protein